MYWLKEDDINAEIVREYMPKNLYTEIMGNLYFSYNRNVLTITGVKDKLSKIRTVLDELSKAFS